MRLLMWTVGSRIIAGMATGVLLVWLVWTVLAGNLRSNMVAAGPDEPECVRVEIEDTRCLPCL